MTRNGEFLTQSCTDPEAEYLVEGLIPRGQIILIAALPGEGKSHIVLNLVYHIAYGALFLGRRTRMGGVQILDNDNPRDVIVKRIRKTKNAIEGEGYNVHAEVDIQHYSGLRLDAKDKTVGAWAELRNVSHEIRPAVILIDNLAAFHSQDENRANEMRRVVDGIETLRDLCESSVVVVHHFNKGNGSFIKRLRGSTVLYAASEVAWEIRTLSRRDGRLESLGVIPQPRKGVTPLPFRVVVEDSNDSLRLRHDGEYRPVEDPALDKLGHMIFHIFLRDNIDRTVNDVKKVLSGMGSDSEIREALRQLDRMEALRVQREKSKSHRYVYSLRATECPWCRAGVPCR